MPNWKTFCCCVSKIIYSHVKCYPCVIRKLLLRCKRVLFIDKFCFLNQLHQSLISTQSVLKFSSIFSFVHYSVSRQTSCVNLGKICSSSQCFKNPGGTRVNAALRTKRCSIASCDSRCSAARVASFLLRRRRRAAGESSFNLE